MIRRALLLAVSLAGVGCATKSDVVDLRTTVLSELDSDRGQRDSLIVEIRQLRAVLLDSLNVQQRRGIAGRVDLQRQVDELGAAIAQLIQLSGEMQRQLTRLGATGNVAPSDSGPGLEPTGGGAVQPGVGEAGGPEALYEAALRQFRRGSYGTARAGFEEFLKKHAGHALAPDAQYFRAETHAETGEVDAALREYARVLELYPNSRRAPTALYKSGLIEVRRGNRDDARTFFSRVVQGYPDSDEAELAVQELNRLRR